MRGNFTPMARAALAFAEKEAASQGRPVSSEHVLLGLLRDPESMAWQVLMHRAVDMRELADACRAGRPAGDHMGDRADEPSSDDIIALADEHVPAHQRPKIAAKHLLLGLLAAKKGLAYDLLTARGVTLDIARATIEALMPEEERAVVKAHRGWFARLLGRNG